MFAEAIEKAVKYTRAIHSIHRNYGSAIVQPGTATLFIVNSEGWALTCGHVADNMAAGRKIVQNAESYKKELDKRKGTIKQNKLLKEVEKKYGYSKKDIFEIYFHFMDCVDRLSGFQLIRSKKY
ncbi:MAG: hypothetical protein WBB97_02620, partial [Dehalococcoidales bacterium]